MIEVIGAAIAAIATVIGAYLKYKSDKNSDVKNKIKQEKRAELLARIEETEKELIKAMETNITDVPGIRMKLEKLRLELEKTVKVVAFFFSIISLAGCKTDPVIVGERIFYVSPAQTVVVPELKKPAKQWYLIDDVAMLKVLGVDKPIEKETITGSSSNVGKN